MNKRVKNEKWCIKNFMSDLHSGKIKKPRFQRKKKWSVLPGNNRTPNEQEYIEFLFKTENSVHPITFGKHMMNIYSNIDGNNRINAIGHFMRSPFEVFPNHLKELDIFINNINDIQNQDERYNLDNDEKEQLKYVFRQLSYNEIINFKYNKYFKNNGYEDFYSKKLKQYRDDFEPVIEKTQTKLKLKNGSDFNEVVINVNIFEEYTTDELCNIFESINKYSSRLTETELLSSSLYNDTNFIINNKVFKTELDICIKKYYEEKADGEVLECFKYNKDKDNPSAFDFIVGFQNFCNEKFNLIGKSDTDGMSLYFKLYNTIYNGLKGTFTTKNVNDFIEKITYACQILKELVNFIFTDNINEKLFNKQCQKKIITLKKNNMFLIISCIIGYHNLGVDKSIIINELEKCLNYHFMVCDLKDKDKKEFFRNSDSISYRSGGSFINNKAKKMLSEPNEISNRITKELFHNLLITLYGEANNPEIKHEKQKRRRVLKFYEKTLMFYYYKQSVPTNILKNKFSIEHICPYSCSWEGKIDKDRPGNLIPVIDTENSGRGNRHISYYRSIDSQLYEYTKDIIPDDEKYNNIIEYSNKSKICPNIINNTLFNSMCEDNEEIYKKKFIDNIFRLQ